MARKEYEMTQEDLDKLYEACKPVPYMVIGGVPPLSTQERVNDAWNELGRRMGFDGKTARPSGNGKGDRFFTAEPTEIKKEAETKND